MTASGTYMRMTNALHTPERHPEESQEAYKARRAQSNAIGKAARAVVKGGISSREKFRDSMRASGTMGKRTRAYVALMAAWASKRVTKAAHRDTHGAYTLVGSPYEMEAAEGEVIHPATSEHVFGGAFGNGGHTSYTARRIWLAGISAQRGY